MQTLVLALLLTVVISLLFSPVQIRLRSLLRKRSWVIWTVPLVLTAVFCGAAAVVGVYSPKLAFMVLAYTLAPVLAVAFAPRASRLPGVLDFLAVALLWFPLEFAAGAAHVPRPAQGFLHSVAYGIAILLGLILFLGFRCLKGMKYNLPKAWRDLWLPLAAFAISAPVLAALGVGIGFIPFPHMPPESATGAKMAAAAGAIFAGTALPEEILFRSLIQNMLTLRFGRGPVTLLVASIIFGAAHLDNGPQPVPNWRYMILATVAGWAYGRVFEKGTSVTSSALLHTMVDWTKHFFF